MPVDDIFDAVLLDEAAHIAAGHDAGLRQEKAPNLGVPLTFFALTSNHPWRLSLTPPCSTAWEESRATRRATRWAHKLASTSVCAQLTVLCLACPGR